MACQVPEPDDADGAPISDRDAGSHAARSPLAMVYGGGGVVGIAYTFGVATGLSAAGISITGVPSLGTSAGSWTASALALGLTYDDLADLPVPSLPSLRPGILADIARRAFGEATHESVSVSAVSLRSGRRHILNGGAHPLADLVAASSAVPGLLPPHRVDGRLYIDGGMWSATVVDAAEDADRVIVIAPLAGRVMGPMGRIAGALLERELGRWHHLHREAQIHMVRPDRTMADIIGVHPLALFDKDRAEAVYPLACAQGERWGELILGSGPDRRPTRRLGGRRVGTTRSRKPGEGRGRQTGTVLS